MPTGGLRSKRKEIRIKKCHRSHPTSGLNTALRIILPINTSDHVPQSLSESKARPEDVLSVPTRLPQNSSDLTAVCPHWNSSGLRAAMQAVPSAWNILLPFFHRAKSLPSLQPAFLTAIRPTLIILFQTPASLPTPLCLQSTLPCSLPLSTFWCILPVFTVDHLPLSPQPH